MTKNTPKLINISRILSSPGMFVLMTIISAKPIPEPPRRVNNVLGVAWIRLNFFPAATRYVDIYVFCDSPIKRVPKRVLN